MLVPHDLAWADDARREAARLTVALGDRLVAVHHIGSTAIPGTRAKAILDLIPVFASEAALDTTRQQMESLGYAWWGEYGLPGRRYYTGDGPVTGARRVQLHGYVNGSAEIYRHLAFRDYLRARPDIAAAYDTEKFRCSQLHPLDSHAYSDCKCEFIRLVEKQALSVRGGTFTSP